MLLEYNAKTRKRILKHSNEMEIFLKDEAYEEQEKGLNTTHLFIDTDANKIAAYISLCNDSIGLELEERNDMGMPSWPNMSSILNPHFQYEPANMPIYFQ